MKDERAKKLAEIRERAAAYVGKKYVLDSVEDRTFLLEEIELMEVELLAEEHNIEDIGELLKTVIAQRDALAAAARRLLPYLPTMDSGPVRHLEHAQAAGELRDALAAVEEGEAK
jgi:hypothetical protein